MLVATFLCQWLNRGAPPLAVGSDLVVDSSPLSRLVMRGCHFRGNPFGLLLFQAFDGIAFGSLHCLCVGCLEMETCWRGFRGLMRSVGAKEALEAVFLYQPTALGGIELSCVILRLSHKNLRPVFTHTGLGVPIFDAYHGSLRKQDPPDWGVLIKIGPLNVRFTGC